MYFWSEAITHSLATPTLQTVEYRVPINALGKCLDDSEKDFRTSPRGVDGVGDSAEVYEMRIKVMLKSQTRWNYDIGKSFIGKI